MKGIKRHVMLVYWVVSAYHKKDPVFRGVAKSKGNRAARKSSVKYRAVQ